MIAVSDAVLIAVSTVALISGLIRWQSKVEQATIANARPAIVRKAEVQVEPDAGDSPSSSADLRQNSIANGASQNTGSTVQGNSATTIDRTSSVSNASRGTSAGNASQEISTQTTTPQPTPPEVPLYGSYVVRPGDTLNKIARQFSTTVATIQEVNTLSGSLIIVGQELLYPLPAN